MTSLEIVTLAGGLFGLVGGIYAFAEKLWGGGNKLATAFAKQKQETTKEIHDLRNEFIMLNNENSKNTTVGIDAIQANIHTMQIGFSDFRAFMAENYVKRDSFYNTMKEFKQDFKETFSELKNEIRGDLKEFKEDIGALAQSVEAARQANNK